MVANVELGRRTLDLGELAALCVALGCPVWEFLAGEGGVVAAATWPLSNTSWPLSALRRALSGEPGPEPRMMRLTQAERQQVLAARGDAETWAARKLGVDPLRISQAAYNLWDRSMTAERDRREAEQGAEAGAGQRARRGHIPRGLIAEIRFELEKSERPPSQRGRK
jgi:hypothetical protein